MRMSGLESRLFNRSAFDLAEAALVASGVSNQAQLNHYLRQLDGLAASIVKDAGPDHEVQAAAALFQRLWLSKPARYRAGAEFRLQRVFEAQVSARRQRVGNCLGLTILYNVLGQRLGLKLTAVHLEVAFGLGPHVFSLMHVDHTSIDIENVLPGGFNYTGHRDSQHRVAWGDRDLVADVYLSNGNRWFEVGELDLAVDCYDKAMRLNPRYESACHNKNIALAELGWPQKAVSFCTN